jgi:hypothetical protein
VSLAFFMAYGVCIATYCMGRPDLRQSTSYIAGVLEVNVPKEEPNLKEEKDSHDRVINDLHILINTVI